MRIKRLFTLTLVLLVMIPVLLFAILGIILYDKNSEHFIRQNMAYSTKVESINLAEFFEQRRINLRLTATLPVIETLVLSINTNDKTNDELLSSVNTILNARTKEHSYIQMMMIADREGTIIAADNPTFIGKPSLIHDRMVKLKRDRVLFTAKHQQRELLNGMELFIASVPIYVDEVYQGCVYQYINMSYIDKFTLSTKLYETGTITIIDGYGAIASTDSPYFHTNIQDIKVVNDLAPQWKQIDFKKEPSGFIEFTINGIPQLSYYSTIPNTDGVVFSTVDWAEVRGPSYNNITWSVLFLLVLIVVIAFVYSLVSAYVSKPIAQFTATMKQIQAGEYKSRVVYKKTDELKDIADTFNQLIDTVINHSIELSRAKHYFETLTENIPGGILRLSTDINYTILYTNDGYLHLLDCTREELETIYNNSYLEAIHPDDRIRVIQETYRQVTEASTAELTFRLQRANGECIHVLERSRYSYDESGAAYFDLVLIDITAQKQAEEESFSIERRYRLALNTMSDLIFEADLTDNRFIEGHQQWGDLNHLPVTEDYSDMIKTVGEQLIYEEDREEYLRTFDIEHLRHHFTYEDEMLYYEYRHMENGTIQWYACTVVPVLDEIRKHLCVIGYVKNINDHKKNELDLLHKSQLDSLTQLYNKGTTETLITNCLLGEGLNGQHVLFVIDFDDFKAINDNSGHLFGDAVLRDVAKHLYLLFRSTDVVGRIGGDEFIAFMKDVTSKETVIRKANEIIRIFQESNITFNPKTSQISASIGISFYPEHGDTYAELFHNADNALYQAKRCGKDCFFIFNAEEEQIRSMSQLKLSLEQSANCSCHAETCSTGRTYGRTPTDMITASSDYDITSFIFNILYKSIDLTSSVNQILALLGERYHLSRVYIFENSEDNLYSSNSYEWCADGIESQQGKLQNVPYSELNPYFTNFNSDGIFYCDDISKLPLNAHPFLASPDIISFLQCAIYNEGRFSGFVGFNECKNTRYPSKDTIHTLITISKIISVFIQKEHAEFKLKLQHPYKK